MFIVKYSREILSVICDVSAPPYPYGSISAGDSFHFRHIRTPSVGLRTLSRAQKGMVKTGKRTGASVPDLAKTDVTLESEEAACILAGRFYLVRGKRNIIYRADVFNPHVGTVQHI